MSFRNESAALWDINLSDNASRISAPSSSQESSIAIAFKVLAYAVILLIGVTGNSFIILAFRRNISGQMRSVYNLMVVSIAVSDLLLAVFSVPERITRVLTDDEWLVPGALGTALCKLVNFVEKTSITVSFLHLGALAMDRFLVVYYPTRAMIGLKASKITSVVIWTITCSYWSPILYYGSLRTDRAQRLTCGVRKNTPNWRAWYIPYMVLLFVTLIGILVLYLMIACKIRLRRVPGNQTVAISKLVERSKRRMARLVAVIVTAYYICFVPYWIGWISCSYIRPRPKVFCNPTYYFINIMVSYVNCAINPIICLVFNRQYRLEARHVTRDPLGLRTKRMRLVFKRRKSSTTTFDGQLNNCNHGNMRKQRRDTQLLVLPEN